MAHGAGGVGGSWAISPGRLAQFPDPHTHCSLRFPSGRCASFRSLPTSFHSCPKKWSRGIRRPDKTSPSSLQGHALGRVPKLRRRGDQARGPPPLASGLLLPRYMAKAVWLQRVVEPDWVLMQNLHCPMCPSALNPSVVPGPASGHQPQPLAPHRPGNAPPGSGEAAALQEVSSECVLGEGWLRIVQVLGGSPTPHTGLALKLERSKHEGGAYRRRSAGGGPQSSR